jgi:hypothetical protein
MTKAIGTRIAATVLLGLVLLLAPVALAGKGGNAGKPSGGSSTLALVVLDPDDGGANYGEQVTFELYTNATDQPYVDVLCYQNGALVYSGQAGFFDGYPWPWTQVFTLSSNAWTGGAADCTAALRYWDGRRLRDLTTLGFSVSP